MDDSSRSTETRAHEAQRAAGVATWTWDAASKRIEWGPTVESVLGSGPLPSSFEDLLRKVHRLDRRRIHRALVRPDAGAGPVVQSFRLLGSGGEPVGVEGRASRVYDGSRLARWCGTLQRNWRTGGDAATDLPETDALTGVATLAGFRYHVTRSIARAQRSGEMVALVLLDLDRFGRINERYGHEAGDLLLQRVAGRLILTVREHDAVGRVTRQSDDWRVSRVGGDKFVVMLEQITSSSQASSIVTRILARLAEPFPVEDQVVSLTARAGISLFPIDGLEATELLQHAEAAMQRTREPDASGPIQFFSRSAALRHRRETDLEEALREAIATESFSLAYQPKVLFPAGRPVSFEALLRYEHPVQGPVPVPAVIDMAERTGLIQSLGRAIFRRVCRDAAWLHAETGEKVRMFTNFSPRQLESPDWKDQVESILEETKVDPELVGIEITESVFVDDRASLVRALEELAARGIEISLDDFGTGYSSFGYLTRLPLNELKIDRSFVSGMTEDAPGSREIAGLLVILGRTLDLRVVAEGVETEEQLGMLHAMGCRVIQGYYFARPGPLETFVECVRRGRLEPAGASVKGPA